MAETTTRNDKKPKKYKFTKVAEKIMAKSGFLQVEEEEL